MCTNTALVNSLECYMDDLVDSFEDFIKKSLILITLGIGAIVGTLLYLLKMVTERSQLLALETQNTNHVINAIPNALPYRNTNALPYGNLNAAEMVENKDLKNKTGQNDTQTSNGNVQNYRQSSFLTANYKANKNITTSPKTSNPLLSAKSNTDETLIRDIGLSSSSKSTSRCKPACMRQSSASKMTGIPQDSPYCIPKNHLSTPRICSKYMANRSSCCSMCCDDDDKR